MQSEPPSRPSSGGSTQSRAVSFAANLSRPPSRPGSRPGSSRSGRRKNAPAVGEFWGQRNVQASTQPKQLSTTDLQLVLTTLIAAVRTQLVPNDAVPTVLQPPVGRIEDNYFPPSVAAEHPDYFAAKAKQHFDEADRKAGKQYLHNVHAEVEAHYPFDRRDRSKAGAGLASATASPGKPGKGGGTAADAVSPARDGNRNWVELHHTMALQKRKRCEHALELLTQEQQRELQREHELLTCPPHLYAEVSERVARDRLDAADWIMRILHDYHLISGLTMAEYLKSSLAAVDAALANREAAANARVDNSPALARLQYVYGNAAGPRDRAKLRKARAQSPIVTAPGPKELANLMSTNFYDRKIPGMPLSGGETPASGSEFWSNEDILEHIAQGSPRHSKPSSPSVSTLPPVVTSPPRTAGTGSLKLKSTLKPKGKAGSIPLQVRLQADQQALPESHAARQIFESRFSGAKLKQDALKKLLTPAVEPPPLMVKLSKVPSGAPRYSYLLGRQCLSAGELPASSTTTTTTTTTTASSTPNLKRTPAALPR